MVGKWLTLCVALSSRFFLFLFAWLHVLTIAVLFVSFPSFPSLPSSYLTSQFLFTCLWFYLPCNLFLPGVIVGLRSDDVVRTHFEACWGKWGFIGFCDSKQTNFIFISYFSQFSLSFSSPIQSPLSPHSCVFLFVLSQSCFSSPFSLPYLPWPVLYSFIPLFYPIFSQYFCSFAFRFLLFSLSSVLPSLLPILILSSSLFILSPTYPIPFPLFTFPVLFPPSHNSSWRHAWVLATLINLIIKLTPSWTALPLHCCVALRSCVNTYILCH